MNDKELKENTIRSAIFVNLIAIMAFAFFIANFTSNNINISEFITISIIILIFTIILNYLIFYEMKFSKYKKESVLLVNNNLSRNKQFNWNSILIDTNDNLQEIASEIYWKNSGAITV